MLNGEKKQAYDKRDPLVGRLLINFVFGLFEDDISS
jgi:hypothetical protein